MLHVPPEGRSGFDQSPYLCYTGTDMRQSTTFKVNQKIVYPSQGVGKIMEIKERSFKDEMILYYVIYLEVSDMTVMVPVLRAEELGIRSIVSKKEAQKALELISEEFEPIPSDWKLRYQMNLDLLKKGSVIDIATIVRSLYHRSKIKELPILERKLYDSARKLLEDEITFALNIPRAEVEGLIHTHLEPIVDELEEPEDEPESSVIEDDDDFLDPDLSEDEDTPDDD